MKLLIARLKDFLSGFSRKQRFIAGGVILLLFIIAINTGSGGGGDGRQQASPVAVQVEQVSATTVEQTVTAAGKIQPVFETEISSTISAQIIDLLVDEGDEVEPGDTLVVLDRLRAEAAYGRAKSALRSATARQRQVKAEIDRGKQLFEKNLISLQDMEALDASYETALSNQEQAQASLEQAVDDLSKTILTAPEKGVVTRINKEVGEMAQGSTFQAAVLLVISDLSSMEVIVDVDETDVVDIEILDLVSIEVDALPNVEFSGRVSRVAHSATVIGSGTQEQATNFEVVVTLDINPDSDRIDPRLRPGMSATATITTAKAFDAIAVPIQALAARAPIPPKREDGDDEDSDGNGTGGSRRGQGSNGPENAGRRGGSPGSGPGGPGRGGRRPEPIEIVFVLVPDSAKAEVGFIAGLFGKKPPDKVVQRPVELGISSDTHYQILSGLALGEEIVIGNYKAVSKELNDGSIITRKEGRNGKGDRDGRRRRRQ